MGNRIQPDDPYGCDKAEEDDTDRQSFKFFGAAGVGVFNGDKVQYAEKQYDAKIPPTSQASDKEQIKDDEIPHDGKADKVHIFRDHAFFAIVKTGDQQHASRRK